MRKWLMLCGSLVLLGFGLAVALFGTAVPTESRRPGPHGPGGEPSAPQGSTSGEGAVPSSSHRGFLYGTVTSVEGENHSGRLRFGGDEEAFWGEYFNGTKAGNPWAAYLDSDQLPKERIPVEVLGVRLATRERALDLDRPFMARFGDIARIDAPSFDEVRVVLKSGSEVDLDRLEASDFDDGVRVWGADGAVRDLGAREIRGITFAPVDSGDTAVAVTARRRLQGTVRTRSGEHFTGFVQWDRELGAANDTLLGRGPNGEVAISFPAIRSLARASADSTRVILRDGRELVLTGSRQTGEGHRGVYVDDPRFGRVLVPWAAFERLDLQPEGDDAEAMGAAVVSIAPAYDDFPPGEALRGRVTTVEGNTLAGRLVFDLDESETTATLDAPSGGVDYTVPFGLVASLSAVQAASEVAGGAEAEGRGKPVPITLHNFSITLHTGEMLRLEPSGDLSRDNLGLLVFIAGEAEPEYVPWSEVRRIDFERPREMYPALPDAAVQETTSND